MRIRVTLSLFVLACTLAACNLLTGISNLNFNEGTGDGGESGDSGPSSMMMNEDSGSVTFHDGSADTSPSMNIMDSALPPPMSTLLVSGGTLAIKGITDDGYIIYGDTSTSTLYAILSSASAGTKPTTLGSADLNAVTISHNGVAFFSASVVNRVGPLSIWESSIGPIQIASASLEPDFSNSFYTVAGSPDGSHVLYYDNVNAEGTTGTLYMYSASGSQMLVGPIDVAEDMCHPQLHFSTPYALASYCTVSGPGGTIPDGGGYNIATISSWLMTDTNPALSTVATSVQTIFAADGDGGGMVVGFTNDLVAASPAGGGSLITLDPLGNDFFLLAGGNDVVYTTSTDTLRRTPTALSSITTLVPNGFSGVDVLSPDKSWIIGHNVQASSGTSDLYAASTSTPGSPLTITTATTSAIGLGGDPFTVDSTYALYQTAFASNLGVLTAFPLRTGGAPRMIAHANYATWGLTGTVIVFNANYASQKADLQWVDVAGSGAPTPLVTGADPYFLVTPAKDKITYTIAGTGLYVMDAPGTVTPPSGCADAGFAYHASPEPPGGCTATGIADFYTNCLSSTQSMSACMATENSLGTGCESCLFQNLTSSSWGALVLTTSDVFVNVGGCYATMGASALPCAAAYETYTNCAATVCGNISDGGVSNCVVSAASAGGACACYLTTANAACAAFSSSPCASTTDDFEMLFTAVATAMCQ